MYACRMKPYEGDEKYIFVSYAHKDGDAVWPLIDRLSDDGFRIWYDDGIAPGTEWPEYVANHLKDAAAVIAFVTPNSAASANCRREITFSLSKNIPFISVMLEPTELSAGLELQLSAQRCILKNNYATEEKFYVALKTAGILAPCKRDAGKLVKDDFDPAISKETVLPKPAKKRRKWIIPFLAALLLAIAASFFYFQSPEGIPEEVPTEDVPTAETDLLAEYLSENTLYYNDGQSSFLKWKAEFVSSKMFTVTFEDFDPDSKSLWFFDFDFGYCTSVHVFNFNPELISAYTKRLYGNTGSSNCVIMNRGEVSCCEIVIRQDVAGEFSFDVQLPETFAANAYELVSANATGVTAVSGRDISGSKASPGKRGPGIDQLLLTMPLSAEELSRHSTQTADGTAFFEALSPREAFVFIPDSSFAGKEADVGSCSWDVLLVFCDEKTLYFRLTYPSETMFEEPGFIISGNYWEKTFDLDVLAGETSYSGDILSANTDFYSGVFAKLTLPDVLEREMCDITGAALIFTGEKDTDRKVFYISADSDFEPDKVPQITSSDYGFIPVDNSGKEAGTPVILAYKQTDDYPIKDMYLVADGEHISGTVEWEASNKYNMAWFSSAEIYYNEDEEVSFDHVAHNLDGNSFTAVFSGHQIATAFEVTFPKGLNMYVTIVHYDLNLRQVGTTVLKLGYLNDSQVTD